MSDPDSLFLPGVPQKLVQGALQNAGGNEITSGKLANPESSAALAVNSFGWFLTRPADLPPFPQLADIEWLPRSVQVERQMRFPWRGGRHPWLDAAVETENHLIGVESKRCEPYRAGQRADLSDAYDRDVWGEDMIPFTLMRDDLRSGATSYRHLDAVQLVKHAFGLRREGRRLGKAPVLLYLYAEPARHGTVPVTDAVITLHQEEIDAFSRRVVGAEVRFAACSYRTWLAGWNGDARAHADAIIARFQP